MTEHERRVEALRQHNHRLQKRLADAEARAERWRRLAAAIIRHDNAEAMGVIDLTAELDEVDAARADLRG